MPSSPASQSAGKLPKQMSSRLLTMKFMQRASASRPDSPVTPSKSSYPGTPQSSTPTENVASSSKRLKLSHTSDMQGAGEAFTPTRIADVEGTPTSAVSMRQTALERSWRGEETKWAFAIQKDAVVPEMEFKVEVLNGRHMDDSEEDGDLHWKTEEQEGRKVFGKKRKQVSTEKHTVDENKSDDSEDSDGSTDSEDSFDRQAQEILNKADTRYSARPNRISGSVSVDRIQCHGCKEFGHMMRNCPSRDARKYHQPMGLRQKG